MSNCLRRSLRAVDAAALPCLVVLFCACAATESPLFEQPDIASKTRSAKFEVRIDSAHDALSRVMRDPTSAPLTVSGGNEHLGLRAAVKTTQHRKDALWLEVFITNHDDDGLRELALEVTSESGLFPLGDAPFGAQLRKRFELGGVAGRGVANLLVGVPLKDAANPLKFTVSGRTTRRETTRSAPLAIDPEDKEVWAAVPDANVVAVIDAKSHARLASVAVQGRPASVAMSSDGKFVLVAARDSNRVDIFERSTRTLSQRFRESDGLGRDPRHVVVTPDGGRALVTSYVGDTVTILARRGDRWRVQRHVAVGRRPAGISVTRDGKTALIAHFLPRGPITNNEAWVTVLDVVNGSIVRETILGDLLNLDRAHCLANVFKVSPIRMTSEGVPNQLAGAFLDPAGARAWVPHATIGGFPILERGPESIALSPAFETRPGEAVPGFVSILDTRAIRDTVALPNPGVLERPVDPSYMKCAKIGLAIETSEADPIPGKPTMLAARFPAIPTGYTGLNSAGLSRFVGFSKGGRRALVLSYISDQLLVFDTATMHSVAREGLLLSGSNPTGLVVNRAGDRAWVTYENTLAVSVIDLTALATPEKLPPATFVPYAFLDVPELPGGTNGLSAQRLVRDVGSLPPTPGIKELTSVALVDKDPMPAKLRRGAVLFTSSNTHKHPTLSAVTMTACASCHPDGHNDGSMWATMEGERRTTSLRGGVRGRGWLHASGTHRDAHEFVDVVVTERLGGQLVDADLDALAGYLADGIPLAQHPKVDKELAAEGKKLFDAKCASCHAGPQFDSGAADLAQPYGAGSPKGPGLFDLGTATKNAHVSLPTFFESLFNQTEADILRLTRGDRTLGPDDKVQSMLDFRPRPHRARGQFKAPSLTGVWDNVLFLHHGGATSLRGAIKLVGDKLGLKLSDTELRALTAYVTTL